MVRRLEIVNFMTPTPRGGNFEVKRVKLMHFFKNLLLDAGTCFRHTTNTHVVMTTKKCLPPFILMILEVGGFVLGRGHIIHIGKMHGSDKLSV